MHALLMRHCLLTNKCNEIFIPQDLFHGTKQRTSRDVIIFNHNHFSTQSYTYPLILVVTYKLTFHFAVKSL